jgi:hypothetical protein
VLACIEDLYSLHKGNLVAYLKPFYDAWISNNYSKTNTAWLTDCAVVNQMPKKKLSSKEIAAQKLAQWNPSP